MQSSSEFTRYKEVPIYVFDLQNTPYYNGFFYHIDPASEASEMREINPMEVPLVGPFPSGDAARQDALALIERAIAELDAEEAKYEFIEE